MDGRGNTMVGETHASRSPVRVVREFLKRLEGRAPTPQELSAIEPELAELHHRLQRWQERHPDWNGVQGSDEVMRLLVACGRVQPLKKIRTFRKAAGLL